MWHEIAHGTNATHTHKSHKLSACLLFSFTVYLAVAVSFLAVAVVVARVRLCFSFKFTIQSIVNYSECVCVCVSFVFVWTLIIPTCRMTITKYANISNEEYNKHDIQKINNNKNNTIQLKLYLITSGIDTSPKLSSRKKYSVNNMD